MSPCHTMRAKVLVAGGWAITKPYPTRTGIDDACAVNNNCICAAVIALLDITVWSVPVDVPVKSGICDRILYMGA